MFTLWRFNRPLKEQEFLHRPFVDVLRSRMAK